MHDTGTELQAALTAREFFRVPLRWRDLDNQSHVYHAEYLVLLDQARTAWLSTYLKLDNADEYIIAHIGIDYIVELTFDSASLTTLDSPAVDITFAISRLGAKSLTFEENIYVPDGTLVARASTVVVLWDRATREARAITAAERSRAACHLIDAENKV